jgi:osmotically-inducible protein OsmY
MRKSLGWPFVLALLLLPTFARPAGAEADALLNVKAKIALLTTNGVSVSDVKVDTHEGAVILHGKVGTDVERVKAEAAVKGVSGVRSVQNLLQVVPSSIRKAVVLSDSRLKEDVTDALGSDPLLKGVEIKVKSVDAGVVLLAGDAETLDQKLAAIERAWSVRGVVRVASEIRAPVTTE